MKRGKPKQGERELAHNASGRSYGYSMLYEHGGDGSERPQRDMYSRGVMARRALALVGALLYIISRPVLYLMDWDWRASFWETAMGLSTSYGITSTRWHGE